MGASLVGMVARASTDWPESGAVVAQSRSLRDRLSPLALADSDAYAEVIAALRLPAELAAGERDVVLAAALDRAAALPLAIAEAAADAADLAAHAAAYCPATVRGDVIAAAVLAEAAVRAAGRLVELNLATTADDDRVVRARALAADAADALRRTSEAT